MNLSATIKIFLPYGDPKSVRVAELSNWSGKAIAAPRSEIEKLLLRPEVSKPGIYLLIGIDPSDGQDIAYIGEAEVVSKRIKQHKSKDDWNSVIVFTSTNENLTKSHIRYLEGRLIEIGSLIGRYKMTNQQSSGAHLPESDQNEMEGFLDRMVQLLPILGTELATPVALNSQKSAHQDTLFFSTKGASSKGYRTPNGFVVLKGSTAVITERDSAKSKGQWVVSLREKLKGNGALMTKDDFLEFTKDVEFGSSSAAAAVVQGGTAQGPVLWKNKAGKTLKEIDSKP